MAAATGRLKETTAAGWLLHNHPRVFLCLDAPAALRLISQQQAPALNVPGFTFLTDEALEAISVKTVICFSPHPDDTAISAGYDGPKIDAREVPRAAFDGLARGEIEVIVDDWTAMVKASVSGDPAPFYEKITALLG